MPNYFLTISIWDKETDTKNNMKDLSHFLVLARYFNLRLTSTIPRNQFFWSYTRNQLLRWYQL